MTDQLTGEPASPVYTQTRVVVVDGRRLIADALAALIRTIEGFVVVDVCDGDAAVSTILERDPQVLLIGAGRDLSRAFEVIRPLRRATENVRIAIVADVLTRELVKFVLDEQVNGLILTDTPAQDLAACLGRVVLGHAVLPGDWQRVLATHGDDPVGSLSDRQLEVLRLVAEGHSYDEIGTRLFISANTVKFHLRSIYMRLGVRNRVAAARMLSERGGSEPTRTRQDDPDRKPPSDRQRATR
jgi:DNA-binding NarL/FixJ family response regulator